MNDDLTIGGAVALLASESHGRLEGVEVGVSGWSLARLVIERARGWLADTDDNAIALLERVEAEPDEEATRSLAQGIDLLLNPSSRVGRDLRSLIRQTKEDEVLACLFGEEPSSSEGPGPPADRVSEVSFQFFEPETRLFPEGEQADADPDESPNGSGSSSNSSRPTKSKRASSPSGHHPNGRDSNGDGDGSTTIGKGPSHRLFPLAEAPEPLNVEGDLFASEADDNA